ncbi:MAG: MBL fold metallo-hydrolase, partial [Planctomycetaceae bacterium]|nr:MBL fold metallo-hydrolase [Planctomycetaceae bacterium]
AKKIGAKRTVFTHISHDLEHEQTNRALPDSMELAYDGMQLALR